MKKIVMISLMLAVAILSGCASTASVKGGPEQLGLNFDLTMYPEQSIGIRVTPALEAGKATVIESPMPDSQVGAEMFGGRISFPGWAACDESGQEGFAQFALVGTYPTGEFMSFVIIDGELSQMRKCKFLPLSSRTDYTFDNGGIPIMIDRSQFYTDSLYRKGLVAEHGIPIGGRKLVKGFDTTVRSWNRYGTSYGDIFSPYDENFVKQIAKINPGYKFSERLVLKNKAVISLNPVEMVAKASITVFEAMQARYRGFDITSELPSRAQMAMIIEFIGKFRLELIRELNEKIAQKDAEIAALKKKQSATSAPVALVADKKTTKVVGRKK